MKQYIVQYMTKYLNIQHFQQFNNTDDNFTKYYDKTIIHPEFSQLYDYSYCFVIAEPGYGKTRLLKEVVLQASKYNKKAFFIDSKKVGDDIASAIKKCKSIDLNIGESTLQKQSSFSNTNEYELDENTIICLDALDELPFSKLFGFLEMVEMFTQENPNVQLFLSCRIHHIQKIDFDLQTLPFEYIELSKFGHYQISAYLENNLKEYKAIDQKIQDHGLNEFLSIPRYLYYFVELIQDKPVDSVLKLTRIELFENFIYRKLDKERGGSIPHSQYDVIKRVLEKIAFLMKMYQVSQLSKDELLTVFEHIDSSLGHILFRDDLLTILYDKSVLKDNLDSIEFENKEFLDFLAAKELLRFEYIEQIFFDLVFEPYLMEVYAEWFYVMPFLFEQHEQLLNQFVDYLVKNQHRHLRDEYFETLTSIEPKLIKPEMRQRIFHLVFDYYTDHNKWFLSIGHYTLSKNLVAFGSSDLVHKKTILSVEDIKEDKQLYVTRINAVEIIAAKFLEFNSEQKEFWKNKFSEWLNFKPYEKYKTLHRHIASAGSIFAMDDFDWIKNHRFIFEEGFEVQNEYARSCFQIAPEDSFSIDVYLEAYDFIHKKTDTIYDDSIRYFARLKTPDAIAYSLKKLMEGEEKKYLHRFLYQSHLGTSDEFLQSFLKHVANAINDEIIQLLKELILILMNESWHTGIHKIPLLIEEILYMLIKHDMKYVEEIIQYLYSLYQNKTIYYHQAEFFIINHLVKYFSKKNFQFIYKQLRCFDDEKHSFIDFAYRLYIAKTLNHKVADLIFKKHKADIQQIELERQKYLDGLEKKSKPAKNICQEWEYKIEPEPDKYMSDLFQFYVQEKKNLTNCPNYESNRRKTIEWAKIVLENNDPLKNGKVEQTSESSHTVWQIPCFNDCIELLLNEDEPMSQTAIDNTFRYLPFNINGDYVNTLKLAKNPSQEAIQDVIDVYSGKREDGLATYHPQNLIEVYKHLRLKESEPLLLNMVENTGIADFIKIEILDVLPNEILTKTKIEELLKRDQDTKKISEKLLAILVQKHNDEDALKRVIKCIIITAKKARVKNDDGSLWSTNLELIHHPLAFVLMNYDKYRIDIDEEFLLLAVELRNKNKKTNAYFLEEIVFGHMKFLRNNNSLEPIHLMEKFLQKNHKKTELHWFEYKFIELKSYYLEKMAKPPHIMNVLKKYQSLQEKEYMVVSSPIHLLEIIKDIIDKDLKSWIENEGAYKYIDELAKKKANRNAEDFIQKTIKSQIELALIKRGFRPSELRIKREEQTLDDRRIDFTVSYGLVGQILIELKLDSNVEAKSTHKKGQEYTGKLYQYIKGSNSDFGIFLIFNVDSARVVFDMQIQKLIEHYSSEELISVMGINCRV